MADQPWAEGWRSGGFILGVTTMLDEGDELAPAIEYVTDWLQAHGYDVKLIHQGERPAFEWEVPA